MGQGVRAATILCVAGLLVALSGQTAGADEAPPDDARNSQERAREQSSEARVVHGHRFIPAQVATWPIVTTRFSSLTSLGSVDASIGGDRSATLLSLRENFQFEWALLKWLAVEGQLLGGVVAATDLRGAFRRGVSYAYGGRAGLLARVLERGPLYLSAFLDGEILPFKSIVPARVQNVVQTGDGVVQIRRPGVSQPGTLYAVEPGLSAALAVLPWLGLQLSAAVALRTFTFEREPNEVEGTVILGTAASFDLGALGIGVTLLLGGRLFQDFGDTDPTVSALELPSSTRGSLEVGAYYSARREANIGLALTSQLGGGDASLSLVPVINYFW